MAGGRMKIVFLLFVLVLSVSCSKNQGSSENIKITEALKAHKKANNFHEWIEGSNSPQSVLRNKALQCEDFSSLSPEQLSIFYSALDITSSQIALSEDCITKLIEKIEAYYLKTNNNSANIFTTSRQHFRTNNRKVPLSPVGGPVFWYGERGGLDNKEVSLTFDDGPHPRLTPLLLNILDEYNVKATFFVLGKNAKRYPEIIEDIVHRGHILANHSHSHHNLPKYSFRHGVSEIESGFDEILNITNQVEPFFRFPYGAKTSALQNYLKQSDVATFFWDVDTLDWKKTNPKELLIYSTNQVYKYNNGIVLFHDVQPQTISVMRDFLSELLLNGYKFARHVSDQ